VLSGFSIVFKIKAAERFKPEECPQYFEDWNLSANAEIGQEGKL
jgi:hypothetical protein